MTGEFAKLYARKEWKDKRREVLRKAGNICEECGSDQNLQAHHPHYEKGKMPWEYDNLQCLCASCHRKADFIRKTKGQPAAGTDVMRGKFFHSLDENGHIEWQGQVLGKVEGSLYLVQLYSWLDGGPTNCTIVPFMDMLPWLFYQSSEEMVHSYDYGVAKRRIAPIKEAK